jgi:predicted N-acetyltransferase YhbS
MPDVTLRPLATSVRQRFLVRAMANVALHVRWAGRGVAAGVVYDAPDLAHAAAAAGIHLGDARQR